MFEVGRRTRRESRTMRISSFGPSRPSMRKRVAPDHHGRRAGRPRRLGAKAVKESARAPSSRRARISVLVTLGLALRQRRSDRLSRARISSARHTAALDNPGRCRTGRTIGLIPTAPLFRSARRRQCLRHPPTVPLSGRSGPSIRRTAGARCGERGATVAGCTLPDPSKVRIVWRRRRP